MDRRRFVHLGSLLVGGSLVRCTSDESINPAPTAPGTGGQGTGGDDGAQGGEGGSGGMPTPPVSNINNLGPLGDPDANGIRLPEGFSSRVLARTAETVGETGYAWHGSPDGGAVFETGDGGWVYVSNAERSLNGGASALRFDASASVVDAYAILSGTRRNCAGGATPWGTWLSCEEVSDGLVFECDPFGPGEGTPRPALGAFMHEAVAVDPTTGALYLTEDLPDGALYRFTPARSADLSSGTLEVLTQTVGRLGWEEVPDPSGRSLPTRNQVRNTRAFNGGEGIWYHDGAIVFTTKGDNRVWALQLARLALDVLYDASTAPEPILTGVDNVAMTDFGDVLVAEDGGDMQIVALTADGDILPVLQIVDQPLSEIAGPAFDPSRARLYFSSQRGTNGLGITYEVSGPFVV